MSEPIYALVQLTITNVEAFQVEYGARVLPHLQSFGGEVITAGQPVRVVEGEYGHSNVVLLRFPDQASFDRWYSDPDYIELKAKRAAYSDHDRTSLLLLKAA
ncbi:MAG: DUF1330 domain-containing protein [Pseudomonadota bacterium]